MNRYDVAAEQARDQMILTNVVRASHAEPLSFVQLGKVSGGNVSSATIGLPSLLLGPLAPGIAAANLQKDVIFGASGGGGSGYVGNSATTGGSTNFDVSPTETKDFYRGLLKEVAPQTLAFFVEQGVSSEILFYLFTSKLLERRGAETREIRNDPLSSDFPAFQRAVHFAVDYGLSSEAKPALPGNAPAASNTGFQLCFNTRLVKPGSDVSQLKPKCGSGARGLDERTVEFRGMDGRDVQLTILPRSTYAIFQYLGRIVASGDRDLIRLFSEDAIDQGPLRDDRLFVLDRIGEQPCFLSVLYEGVGYCVPIVGASNTKRVLSLLTQLIALNTSVDEVPRTPTVRLIQ